MEFYSLHLFSGIGGGILADVALGARRHIARLSHLTVQEKKAMVAGNGGKLNPMWVEWLMGFPIGWTSSAGSTLQKKEFPG